MNAALALAALADVDVELPANGPPRDLDLQLLGEVAFIERTTAAGAAVGQIGRGRFRS